MILHATDLHFRKDAFEALAIEAIRRRCDVCISGDLVDASEIQGTFDTQVTWISKWVSQQPFKLLLCSGNQDDDPLNEPFAGWLRRLHDGVRVFSDGNSGTTSAGVPFVCLPFFAGPYDSRTQRQLDAARIVVTHVGPTGVATARGSEDEGDVEIAEYLKQIPASDRKLLLTGHTHSPAAHTAKFGAATILNPGGVGRHSLPVNLIDDGTLNSKVVKLALGGARK